MKLEIDVTVDSIKKLEEYIKAISKYNLSVSNKEFQKYLQDKFLEAVKKVSLERLQGEDLASTYNENHKIQELDDGFILYNDTMVETESEGYDGKFSIALAFEYGTGLIGQENPKIGAWQYNVKGHEKGWIYFKDGLFHFTRGFEGYEIYRFTAEEIRNNLKQWILDYIPKNGGIK